MTTTLSTSRLIFVQVSRTTSIGAFTITTAQSKGGEKFHIQGETGHPWYTDHGVTTGALNSHRLLALVRITTIPTDRRPDVGGIVTEMGTHLDGRTDITCRIYVQEACERLKANGLLRFPTWRQLETEVFAFGNQQNPVVARGINHNEHIPKPRPVVISTVAS